MAESRRKFDQDFKEGAVRSPSESPARRHHDRDRGSPISGGAVHRAGHDLSSRSYLGSVAHWRICPRHSTGICQAARLNGPPVQSQ
jgi:hypothetical protein